MDSSTTPFWTGLFPIEGCLVIFFITMFFFFFFFFKEIPVVNANSEDPDQTPRSVTSVFQLPFGGLQT